MVRDMLDEPSGDLDDKPESYIGIFKPGRGKGGIELNARRFGHEDRPQKVGIKGQPPLGRQFGVIKCSRPVSVVPTVCSNEKLTLHPDPPRYTPVCIDSSRITEIAISGP